MNNFYVHISTPFINIDHSDDHSIVFFLSFCFVNENDAEISFLSKQIEYVFFSLSLPKLWATSRSQQCDLVSKEEDGKEEEKGTAQRNNEITSFEAIITPPT